MNITDSETNKLMQDKTIRVHAIALYEFKPPDPSRLHPAPHESQVSVIDLHIHVRIETPKDWRWQIQ